MQPQSAAARLQCSPDLSANNRPAGQQSQAGHHLSRTKILCFCDRLPGPDDGLTALTLTALILTALALKSFILTVLTLTALILMPLVLTSLLSLALCWCAEIVPAWFRSLSAKGAQKQLEDRDKLKAGMYGVVRR